MEGRSRKIPREYLQKVRNRNKIEELGDTQASRSSQKRQPPSIPTARPRGPPPNNPVNSAQMVDLALRNSSMSRRRPSNDTKQSTSARLDMNRLRRIQEIRERSNLASKAHDESLFSSEKSNLRTSDHIKPVPVPRNRARSSYRNISSKSSGEPRGPSDLSDFTENFSEKLDVGHRSSNLKYRDTRRLNKNGSPSPKNVPNIPSPNSIGGGMLGRPSPDIPKISAHSARDNASSNIMNENTISKYIGGPDDSSVELRSNKRAEYPSRDIQINTEVKYSPIAASYLKRLTKSLMSNSNFLEDSASSHGNEVSKDDFLTEDGYYNWVDSFGTTGFEPFIVKMLNLWDIRYPLMSEDHLKSKNSGTPGTSQINRTLPAFETTVNLVLRVIEARNLKSDSKGRGRNTFALIKYSNMAAISSKSNQGELRYETNIVKSSCDPYWNQEITLTINNLIDPISISVFGLKEKTGLLKGDVKEDFLGSYTLNVQNIISKAAKSGFVNEWFALEDPSGKYKSKTIGGDIHLEVELAGISESDKQDAFLDKDNFSYPKELRDLKSLQHRLFTDKVKLKAMYTALLKAIINLEICSSSTETVFSRPIRKTPHRLSSESNMVLGEFARVWMICPMFRKMKYLQFAFNGYKSERIHARSLLQAYRDLYEDVFKHKKIWLPDYEKPELLQLMTSIEIYTTSQIKSFKEFFPIEKNENGEYDSLVVEHIAVSLDSILLLTRMIDKNDMFLTEAQKSRYKEKDDEKRAPLLEPKDADDPFVTLEKSRMRRNPSANTDKIIDRSYELKTAAITEYDYKNGKFRFTEKLYGLIHSRAVLRYAHLAESAMPSISGPESIATTVYKCRELVKLMIDDVDEDIKVYSKGFKNENDFILEAVDIQTFLKYFVLEMENLSSLVRDRQKRGSSLFSEDEQMTSVPSYSVTTDSPNLSRAVSKIDLSIPETEIDMIYLSLDLMHLVDQMRAKWSDYIEKDHIIQTSPAYWFSPFLARFLILLRQEAFKWVENAISLEDFNAQVDEEVYHSSSPTDISTAIFQSFDAVKQSMNNIIQIDELPLKSCALLARFSSVIYSTVHHYSKLLQDTPLRVSSNVKPKTLAESVLKYFGKSHQNSTELEYCRTQLRDISPTIKELCTRISNLNVLGERMHMLFQEMPLDEINQRLNYWRKEKAIKTSKSGIKGGITGLVRLTIILATNLKLRSAIAVGKPNSYVVIKRKCLHTDEWEEVGRTRVVRESTNPLFFTPSPSLTDRTMLNPPLLQPCEFVFPVQDSTCIMVHVYNKSENSLLPFGNDGNLLAEATLPLSYERLMSGKSSNNSFISLELSPQGSVLLQFDMPTMGVSNLYKPENISDDTVSFGLGGLEDLEYWKMKTQVCINQAMYSLSDDLSDDFNAIIFPILQKSIKSCCEKCTGSKFGSKKIVDQEFALLGKVLDMSLSLVTYHLPDTLATQILHLIWIKCFLYPFLHYTEPTDFYSDIIKPDTSSEFQFNIIQTAAISLKKFFHAGGKGLGLPLDLLENTHAFLPGNIIKSVNAGKKLFPNA